MNLYTRLRRREDGYIGITAMGIILLLVGTSILLMGSVRDQITMARESQKFTSARQAVDVANAAALRAVNDGTFDPRKSGNFGSLPAQLGQFSYGYDANELTLNVVGESMALTQEQKMPLRWVHIGSKSAPSQSAVLYGLAANGRSRPVPAGGKNVTENAGAWSFGLTAGDVPPPNGGPAPQTLVRGSFFTDRGAGSRAAFDVALLGGNATLNPTNTTRPQVIGYTDSATANGNVGTYRSHLNLQFDRELLHTRTTGQQFTDCARDWAPIAGVTVAGRKYCAEHSSYPFPAMQATGVTTVIIKGNAVIGSDIVSSGTGQLHLYVTGDVSFSKPQAQGQQRLTNVFVYAPNGTCSTAAATQSVVLRGSLACRSLRFESASNSFTHVRPQPDVEAHAGAATTAVYYTESPGYVDTRTLN